MRVAENFFSRFDYLEKLLRNKYSFIIIFKRFLMLHCNYWGKLFVTKSLILDQVRYIEVRSSQPLPSPNLYSPFPTFLFPSLSLPYLIPVFLFPTFLLFSPIHFPLFSLFPFPFPSSWVFDFFPESHQKKTDNKLRKY